MDNNSLSTDQASSIANELYGQPQTADYGSAVDAIKENQRSSLQQSMYVATQRDPNQYGRVNQLASKYGVNSEFVASNQNEFERKDKLNSMDYDRIIRGNEKLSEFLKNPDHATLAQDDISVLQKITNAFDDRNIMGQLSNATLSGLAKFNSNLAKVPAFAYDLAALPQNILYNMAGSDRRVQSPEWARNNPVSDFYDKSSKAYSDKAPELSQSIIDAAADGDYSRAGKILALQVVNNLPQQAANIGLGLANPAYGLAMAGATTGADKNADNVGKVDPIIGTLNAALNGTIEAGFEHIGTFGLLDKWGTSLRKTYGEATTREIIKETGKALGSSFLGEANEEALTSIAQGLADKHMGVSPDLKYTDILKDAVNSGLVGGFSGGLMTGPTAVADGAFGIRARLNREQDLNFYRKFGELAQNSKLRERAPEKFKDLVEQVAEGTGVENVYMPVEGVDSYFQSKGINPTQYMNEIGLSKQYDEAKSTGGNIEIKLSDWTEKIGNSEHFRGLEDHIKFNPEALTRNEERQESGRLNDLIQSAENEAKANLENPETKLEQEKVEFELNQVKDLFRKQLEATGKYTPQLVQDQVQSIIGPVRYFAKANNMTPMEFVKDINLQIKSGEFKTPEQRTSDSITNDISSLTQQPQGIPSHDESGNRIYDDNIVDSLKIAIDQGEAGKRGIKTNDTGEVTGSIGQESTFPEFFKNKGYNKKDTLAIIEKFKNGEKLSEKQQAIFDDLYDGALDKTNRGEFFQSDRAFQTEIPYPESVKIEQFSGELPSVKDARKLFKETINGSSIVNQHTGWNIQFYSEGEGKAGSKIGSPENRLAYVHAPKLLENAIYARTELDREARDENIKGVHVFYAPFMANGKDYIVSIKVREYNDGKKYYDKYTLEKEKPTDLHGEQWTQTKVPSVGNGDSLVKPTPPPREVNIDQFLSDIKALHQGDPFFQGGDTPRARVFTVRPDMPKEVKVLRLPESVLTEERHKSLKDAKEYASDNLRNRSVRNEMTGMDIDLPQGGFKKVYTGKPDIQNIIALTHIDQLIQGAVFDGFEPVSAGKIKPNVKGYYRFYAPMSIGEKEYLVRIKVSESNNGTKFYHEVGIEKEIPAGNLKPKDSLKSIEQADSGDNEQYAGNLLGQDSFESGTQAVNGQSSISIEQFAQAINEGRKKYSWFQGEENHRARVIFDKYGISIDLFKGSDPTSLMHEMGHVYLEMFKKAYKSEQAPEWLKTDAEKVLKYLGTSSFDDIKTEHHELWARSVEQYLYDGKAPTPELVSAFARMKMWFRKIYTDVKGALGVELNPEIRNVMDRVFAGETLINDAEKQYAPLFPDSTIRTLSGAQQQKYSALLEKYHAKAVENVTQKLMEQHTKERRKWWNAETNKIQEIFKNDLAKQRQYSAQNYIKTGELPNGEKATDPRAHLMSRESLKETFGKVPAWVKRNMVTKDGVDVNFLSDILGYNSVQEFNEEMSKTEDLDAVSRRMAEEYMKKEYGDAFSDQTQLREMVENAVHNDKKAQVLRAELEFLASEDLPALKGLIRKIGRRPPSDPLMRAKAEGIIAKKPISEIQPYIYQRAEAKAAREAADLLAKGDRAGAFDAKQRELLNFYLYQESMRAKELVRKQLEFTKGILDGSTGDVAERRDFAMVSLARVLLSEYGLTERDVKTAQDYLDQLNEYDPDSYEGLKPLVYKWLLDKKDYKKMSLQDFSEFMEDIEALWSLSRSSREIEINGVKQDIQDVALKLSERLSAITTKPYKPGVNKAATNADMRLDKFMSAKSSIQRVEAWADIVDHGDENKSFDTYMVNPVREAVVNYKLKKKEIIKAYSDLISKMPKESLSIKNIEANEINYIFKDKAELLAALLHTGNDSNLFKLLVGRQWGEINENTGAVDPTRWNKFIDRMHAQKILLKSDWDFIQGVWNLNESIKPDAQKAHKDMYGHFFNEVTAKKFMTPFGEYQGGYMPAVTDPFIVEDSRIRQEQETILNNNNSFMFPTTGRGFTKGRVAQYAAPLLLDMNMVASHFDKVLRFTYIEPTVKKVARINNNKDYRAVLREYDPYAGSNLINPWLQRSAQQRVVQPSQSMTFKKIDGVVKFLRSSACLQILGLNLSNAMQQLTGVITASSKVSPKYLTRAIGNYTLEPNVTKAEIMELSPWMKTRLSDDVIKLNDEINEQLFNPSKFEKVADFAKRNGLVLSEMFQHMVDMTVWQGAYMEALDQGMTKDEAIKRADKEVRLTQGSANAEDISSIEEGTHWTRLFTQFYGYPNMVSNLLGTETMKKVRTTGWKSAVPTLLPFYLSAYMLPGLAAQAIAQMMSGQKWDADDDGDIIDDLAWMTLSSMYKGIFAMVPMVGQFANMMIGQFTKEKYDDRLSLSPAMQQLENIGKTVFNGYKIATDAKDLSGQDVKTALSTLGFMSGIPIGPLGKPVGYMMDIKSGKGETTGPIDFARGMVSGRYHEQ